MSEFFMTDLYVSFFIYLFIFLKSRTRMGPPRPLKLKVDRGLSIPRGVFRDSRPSPSAESAVENEVV